VNGAPFDEEPYSKGMAANDERAADEEDMVETVRSRGCWGKALMLGVVGTGKVATERAEEKDGLRPPPASDRGGDPDGGDSEMTEWVAVRRDGDANGGVLYEEALMRGWSLGRWWG